MVVLTSVVANGLLLDALIGNVLVLAAICKITSRRTPCYIVLSGLALADILGTILSQPSYIAWAVFCFAKHSKKYNYLSFTYFARVQAFCWHFLRLLTLLLLTLVSIERWASMARPLSICVHRTYFFMALATLLSKAIVKKPHDVNHGDHGLHHVVSLQHSIF